MAIILQSLCARLGIASGRDLAQACRDAYPALVAYPLWFLAEFAICATDLAEVIGTAIGLNLLFGIPLEIGVILTALDVFLILSLQRLGFRYLEAFIVDAARRHRALLRRPDRPGRSRMGRGDPRLRADDRDRDQSRMLYLALGILGATVMPHNLYLHSAIVQTRAYGARCRRSARR